MSEPNYIHINDYTIDANTIKDCYPCNIFGDFDNEDTIHTLIKFIDGFEGMYFINYEVLLNLLNTARG